MKDLTTEKKALVAEAIRGQIEEIKSIIASIEGPDTALADLERKAKELQDILDEGHFGY